MRSSRISQGIASNCIVWGQRASDKQALMPVITPTYPAFNSTYNISLSTKAVLLNEFTRGYMVFIFFFLNFDPY